MKSHTDPLERIAVALETIVAMLHQAIEDDRTWKADLTETRQQLGASGETVASC